MNEIRTNPLITRQDVARGAVQLIAPAARYLSPGKARLLLGSGSAHYSEDIAGMEGFSRVLWALVPLLAGRFPEAEPYWALWKEGIIHGTDPNHEEYWGDIGPYDQRMVEMAVMGTALCLIPDRFWDEFTPLQRENLYRWLNQINLHDMPKNNWRFFRVLVNLGFLTVGKPVDEDRLKEDLALAESHYADQGWYFDEVHQRDYYTLWGFHYYGLVYAHVMKQRDPEGAARFIERAKLIAPRFACWFDGEGRALPYGRSQTYRFAQGSYWSAMALAGVTTDTLGWGEIKGFILRNLRFWARMPIFDRDGVLSVGYGYPNLCMTEGYNAPGSPYWGMKDFAILALPEDHPFWTCEEKTYLPPAYFREEQARMLITRDAGNHLVTAYTAGNHAGHVHSVEKYEKFAYSTQFGFSMAKEPETLEKGAFDSMLALRGQRGCWHVRDGCERFAIEQDRVTSTWSPMDGVTVDTTVIPVDGHWHVRRHVVRTSRPLEAADGAFAVCRDWAGKRPCDRICTETLQGENFAAAHGARGSTAIYALAGYERGLMIWPECNTNMIHARTVLPMLRAVLEPGEKELICAVWCAAGDELPEAIPEEVLSRAK